jgi:hypothetical protein
MNPWLKSFPGWTGFRDSEEDIFDWRWKRWTIKSKTKKSVEKCKLNSFLVPQLNILDSHLADEPQESSEDKTSLW